MAIEKLGFPVVSLLGWQAGFYTSSAYGTARIKRVTPDRIKKEIDKRNIVVVTGFQGVNRYDDMTTLGRGGSDTSAVAIAAVHECRPLPDLHRCGRRITQPIRAKVKGARKLERDLLRRNAGACFFGRAGFEQSFRRDGEEIQY